MCDQKKTKKNQQRANNKIMTLYHVRLWLLFTEELLVFYRVHTKICLYKVVYVYMFGGGNLGWKKKFPEKVLL